MAAGCIPKEKVLLDGYLEDYEGLCNKKQVSFTFLNSIYVYIYIYIYHGLVIGEVVIVMIMMSGSCICIDL